MASLLISDGVLPSATTDLVPPGTGSLAIVVNRCTRSTRKSFMAGKGRLLSGTRLSGLSFSDDNYKLDWCVLFMWVYQLSCLRSYSPHQSESRSCGQTTDLLQSLMELPIGGEYDLGALRWHSPMPPNEPLPSSSPGRYPKNWQLLQVSFLSVILIPHFWPVMYIVTDVILSVFYRQDKD